MSTKNPVVFSGTLPRPAAFFLILELVLYISFLVVDILLKEPGTPAATIKLISILCCLVFRLLLYRYYKNQMSHCITLALLFTFLADCFFLKTKHSFMGILFFTGVQGFYRLYLRKEKGAGDFIMMLCGFILGIMAMRFLFAFPVLPFHVLLPVFYFLFLLYNNFTSWREIKTAGTLFSLGLLLLLLCDIQVGLNGASLYLGMQDGSMGFLSQFNFNAGIWFFYLPSQVCIVYSDISPLGKSGMKA